MNDAVANTSSIKTAHLVGWALLAFALSLGRHLPFAGDPFDGGLAAYNSGRVQGAIQRTYTLAGFVDSLGRPCVRPLPTEKISGPTYGNHPPLLSWINYAVVHARGLDEMSLRLYAIVMSALGAALIVVIAGRHGGHIGASVALLAYVASPTAFFHGRMSGYEAPIVALGTLTLLLWPLGRVAPRRFAAACFVLVVAVLHDWIAAFVVPGALLLQWGAKRYPVRWKQLFIAGFCCVGAVLAYLCLLAVWEGGFDGLRAVLGRASDKLAGRAELFTGAEWVRAQGRHIMTSFGWPAGFLAVFGVFAALSRALGPGSTFGGWILAWTQLTLVNVALFPARAWDHDFWWHYFLPVAALSSAWVAVELGRRVGTWGPVAVAAAVLVGGVLPTLDRYRHENDGEERKLVAVMDRLGNEKTMLVSQGSGTWYFYNKAWNYDALGRSLEQLPTMLDRFKAGDFPRIERIHIVLDLATLEEHPEVREDLKARGLTEIPLEFFSIFVTMP